MGMPPRGWLLSGWALLPLRAFLACTFLYAGLQKLANPAFFNPASQYSLHSQMLGYIRSSPIRVVLEHLLRYSTPLGVGIALGEVAIGVGMALGLWTRVAAIGGMLISFSLFLTVSFHSTPWYTGADIVFFVTFMPFAIAGSGGVLSLDARIARLTAREHQLDDPEMVVVPFAEVQRVCGFFKDPKCTAIRNRLCAQTGCPYLEGVRQSLPGGRGPDEVDRRAVVLGGLSAAAAAAAGLVAVGGVAIGGRLIGRSKGPSGTQATLPSTTTQGTGGALGTAIGPAVDVPVGQSATFTVPDGTNSPGLVIQVTKGQFVAYNATCPHEACTVGFQPSANIIACPCHGSVFQVSNGAALSGPAFPRGLTALTVTDSDGKLYVK
jgi:thiosulfate dehydrogenase [quinone] large subunit